MGLNRVFFLYACVDYHLNKIQIDIHPRDISLSNDYMYFPCFHDDTFVYEIGIVLHKYNILMAVLQCEFFYEH